ncbi:MAG: hypothetical protein ACRD50_05180 [Candidatus Acidiferrales bacterium]
MSCPICQRRKPNRYCPAKGEKICAVCCGTEREVTIDCPSDCPHLVASRRYEAEHRRPVAAAELPYPSVEFSSDLVHDRGDVIFRLGAAILRFAAENRALVDAGAIAALRAFAETLRTLTTGIYYEKPPDSALPRELYTRLAQTLQDYKKQTAERAGFAALKDSEAFNVLVFLLRVASQETNHRPLSRAFLDFLRVQFPRLPEEAREAPRIIVP